MRRLLLVALLTTAVSAQPDGLAGRWSGAAVYDAGSLRLFDLEIAVDGTDLDVTLTQPYNGFTRFGFPFAYEAGGPADGYLVAGLFGDEMRLLVDLADGTLRGTVVSDGETAARVSLERVLDYPLPSYRLEAMAFQVGADTLDGTLILPHGEGPFPAVVLVAGRGYGYGRSAMADWGTMLARNGIAALAYDPIGIGTSTGTDSLTTGADRVRVVGAALDAVRARPEVRADAVGIVSNSAGAWVTPVAIQDRDDVAFWVALVPPAGSLAEQQASAVREAMRRSGEPFTEADYTAATAYQTALVERSGAGVAWAEIAPLVDAARATPWGAYADLPDGPTDEQPAYFARRGTFDNTDALRRLRVPTLAIFGAADAIVPLDDHAPRFRAWAAEAGNDALTVLVLPGVDHSLGRPAQAVGEGDWPTGYQRVWGRPGVLFTTIVAWTRAQVGLD